MSCILGACDVVWVPSLFGVEHKVWMEHKRSTRQLELVHRTVTHGVPRRSLKAVGVARVLAPPPDAKSCSQTLTIFRGLDELEREVARFEGLPCPLHALYLNEVLPLVQSSVSGAALTSVV